jgi:hypothetical protein
MVIDIQEMQWFVTPPAWALVALSGRMNEIPGLSLPKTPSSSSHFNKRLQAMAIMYGLGQRCVSSHSLLRIGGTTAMAAAGMSEYGIKQMDG